MKVLVSGGAGFIGSHVVESLLGLGHDVVVLDDLSAGHRANLPAGVPLHEVDITDAARVAGVLARERPDAVCHQAAQISVSRSVREPAADAHVNVVGLLHVLEAAAAAGCPRFVFASSGGALYGDVTTPAPEDHAIAPASPYGVAKWAGEQYLALLARQHGLTAVALRYANVYGPRQDPHGEAGVVAIFCQRLLAGQATTIFGDGGCVRDYVHVADVARANVYALCAELPELRPGTSTPINIGTGAGTSVNDLERAVRREVGRALAARGRPADPPPPARSPPRAGDLRSSMLDPALAARTLGWRPAVELAEGLRLTVEWFADRRHPGPMTP